MEHTPIGTVRGRRAGPPDEDDNATWAIETVLQTRGQPLAG